MMTEGRKPMTEDGRRKTEARRKAGLVPRSHSEEFTLRIHSEGFTLVEMLTVLVIMGIIMGIGIPAVTNLMKSSGLSAATRQVHNTLSFARQYAITQRVYARVVFPYNTSQSNMLYQTYAVMCRNAAGAWQYASKWESLPIGVVFLNRALAGGTGYGGLNDANSLKDDGQLAYIEFTPTGAASQASTFMIAEGFMTSGAPNRPNTNNYATLTVDNVVGRIKVARP